ncbi:hypothetical protein VE00_10291 [Pseudogymnoascus sp. WSF 3629]|nr:hypothetical protein VE00_10291 [Pseudogymnoascus sp. WSF 3629]
MLRTVVDHRGPSPSWLTLPGSCWTTGVTSGLTNQATAACRLARDCYDYGSGDIESYIEKILGLFAAARPRNTDQSCPALVSDGLDTSGPRCGFPDEEAHARDRSFLYINNLHADQEEQGESITSFFVRRSVYFAFFGRLPKISTNRRSSPAPPPDAGAERAASSPFLETQVSEVDLEIDDERLRHNTLEEERLHQERSERDRLEQLNGDGNDTQEADDSFQVPERDRRQDTQIDIERIIARGLASIPEGTEDPPEHSGEQKSPKKGVGLWSYISECIHRVDFDTWHNQSNQASVCSL